MPKPITLNLTTTMCQNHNTNLLLVLQTWKKSLKPETQPKRNFGT